MKRNKVALPLSVLLMALAMLISPTIASADIFSGKVVSVADGDTINILHDNVKEKVILYGIDCPETGQAFGAEAKKFTDDACYGKVVNVEDHGKDSRGRTIGVVLLPDGTNLNRTLVKQGLAWWSDKFAAKDTTLKQLHETAKAGHVGLWADSNPVPPWIFRNGDKGVQATVMPRQQ
jgi:micrococcal nuclease